MCIVFANSLNHCLLLLRENVILTPHVAFYSKMSMYLNKRISMENAINVIEGNLDKTNKIVNK